MQDWVPGVDPLTLDFKPCQFWIHVKGLKEEFLTREIAKSKKSNFGQTGWTGYKKSKSLKNLPKKRYHPYPTLGQTRSSRKKQVGFPYRNQTLEYRVGWNQNENENKNANALIVDSERRRVGPALLWGRNLDVEVISYSTHHIEAIIREEELEPWRLVGFYGHHEVQKPSWQMDIFRRALLGTSMRLCGGLNIYPRFNRDLRGRWTFFEGQ
ncbi:hypothetical protein LIER_32536 [Lithospermum erythrorhizon]|uniref:Uncharacterized protein n=1 Tax=Lithospermum erythrorhizon TaxID=34254 RepID=A0AAV3RU28_LITER